ncbi:hypothetical protein [Oceanobacillus sp. CF4.6]
MKEKFPQKTNTNDVTETTKYWETLIDTINALCKRENELFKRGNG